MRLDRQLVRDDRREFEKLDSVTAHVIHGPGELKHRNVFESGIRSGNWARFGTLA